MGFFKPLRRKIGVLTLAIACVVMGVWLRGRLYQDGCQFTFWNRNWTIISNPFGLSCFSAGTKGVLLVGVRNTWKTVRLNPVKFLPTDPWTELDWRTHWHHLGSFVGQAETESNGHTNQTYVVIVELWSLVVPLTLLSTYLLFSKPRQKPFATRMDVQP